MLTVAKLVKKSAHFFQISDLSLAFHLFNSMKMTTLRPRNEIPRLGLRAHVPPQIHIVLYFPSTPSGLRQQQMLLRNQHIGTCVMGTARKLEGNMTIVK